MDGSIYVLFDGTSRCKVGRTTKAPEERMATIQSANGGRLAVVFSQKVSDASSVERRAHWILAERHERGEWFAVSPEVAREAVMRAITEHEAGAVLPGPFDKRAPEKRVARLRLKKPRKAILLTLPPDLVAQIDDQRGDVPRTVWITRACEKHLANLAFSANLDEVLAVTHPHLPRAFPEPAKAARGQTLQVPPQGRMESAMKWTAADLEALNELGGMEQPVGSRIVALKWAYDLVRSQGDDKLADAIDDILTEHKHVARRRAEATRGQP